MLRALGMVLESVIEDRVKNLIHGEILFSPCFFINSYISAGSLMSINEDLEKWIDKISQLRPELGGFSICPYAKNSRYKILESKIEELEVEDGYDVIIFVVDIGLSLEVIQNWCKIYNEKCPEWKFFEDCASYDTFIQGIQTNNGKYNLILAQPKEKLRKYREILAKTNYYKTWEKEYLQEILEEDYNLLDKG